MGCLGCFLVSDTAQVELKKWTSVSHYTKGVYVAKLAEMHALGDPIEVGRCRLTLSNPS